MTMKPETISYIKDLYWGGDKSGGLIDDIWEDLWTGETPRVDPHYYGVLNEIADNFDKTVTAIQGLDAVETATRLHRIAVLAIAMQLQMVAVAKEGFDG